MAVTSNTAHPCTDDALLTPPLPSPTRTITFITPYTTRSQQHLQNGSERPAMTIEDPQPLHQTPAVRSHQLPPSPELPSPPATTIFLYYRESEEAETSFANIRDCDPREEQPLVDAGAGNRTPSTAAVDESAASVREEGADTASTSSSLDTAQLIRDRDRLLREIQEEMLRDAAASPASPPSTNTFHFGTVRC